MNVVDLIDLDWDVHDETRSHLIFESEDAVETSASDYFVLLERGRHSHRARVFFDTPKGRDNLKLRKYILQSYGISFTVYENHEGISLSV